jgi:hypothetical protein
MNNATDTAQIELKLLRTFLVLMQEHSVSKRLCGSTSASQSYRPPAMRAPPSNRWGQKAPDPDSFMPRVTSKISARQQTKSQCFFVRLKPFLRSGHDFAARRS